MRQFNTMVNSFPKPQKHLPLSFSKKEVNNGKMKRVDHFLASNGSKSSGQGASKELTTLQKELTIVQDVDTIYAKSGQGMIYSAYPRKMYLGHTMISTIGGTNA